MDLTFSVQALCTHHLANNHGMLGPAVHLLPNEIDDEVARIKLKALGIGVDTLTPKQEEFLLSWHD
jgi:adenosylhomocysteinase